MSDVIKHSKKVLSVALTITTIVWSVSLFALAPVSAGATAGDLVKAAGGPAVYLVDADGVTIHPFPHANVYSSWGFPADFSSVITTDISGFTVGNDVEFRDGALVRALETPAVYIKSAGSLRPVVSANVFETLGYNYDNITWLPQSFLDKYSTGDMVNSTTMHPDGTLVKYASSSTVYLVKSGQKRAFASSDVIKVNGYSSIPVITIPSSETYTDGSKIVVKESSLTVPVGVGTAPTTTTPTGPVGSGLTVALASDTPAAASIIDDSTSTTSGAQAFVPFAKVALTAGSDGAVKVTTLKFTRSGISSDADVVNLYLYEGNDLGDNLLSASTAFNSGVVTFTNSNGLITVPAGQTKYVMLRADVANDTGSGKTINFKVASASDVTTDGAAVSGSFPVAGNTMSVATAGDLGYVTVANVSPSGAASVNPGTSNHEAWRFSLAASDQDMEIRYLKISMTGSASTSDLSNFRLQVGGVDIASPVSAMNTNDEIVFNFSTPYKITAGQTKNVSLVVDVLGGSSRTLHFQIQELYHVNAFDTEYNVYTKLNQADTWTIIESNTSSTNTSINAGSLTISKSTDSANGNVAAGATSVSVARFDFRATGEDVRVSSLKVTTAISGGLDNVKTYFKGSQVGSTSDADATNLDADFTYGTSVVVSSGTTETLEVKSDIKNAAGSNLSTGNTFAVTLAAGTSNARALSSSTSISTSAVTGNTLTVATGSLLVAENLSVQDATSANPSGVAGQENVVIGSFVITAGSGEGVTVTQITLTDDAGTATGSSLADQFLNLRLESGGASDANGNYTAGALIGTMIGTLTDTKATTYNFNPSPSIRLEKSQQLVVNIMADLQNSATQTQLDTINDDTDGIVYPSTITATGNDTSSSASGSMSAGLQNVYIASIGSLTAAVSADTPEAATLVMGATDVSIASFDLTATNSEDIEVTKLVFSVAATPATTAAAGTATSTLGFMKNFDLLVNGVYAGTLPTAATTDSSGRYPVSTSYNGFLEYDLSSSPLTIVRGTVATIAIRGDVNTSVAGTDSNAQYQVIIDGDYSNTTGTQNPIEARGAKSQTSLTGINIVAAATDLSTTKTHVIRKTKPTIATVGSGATLSNTTATIYKFSVTADANANVSIKKMTFDISLTDTDSDQSLKLTSFSIRETGASSALSGVGFFTDTGNGPTHNATTVAADLASDRSGSTASVTTNTLASSTFQMIFGYDPTSTTNEELVIQAGTTKTFEIRAAIAGTEVTGDSVAVRASTLNESAVETNANGVVWATLGNARMNAGANTAASNDYFVWSDNSAAAGTHDATVDTTSTDFFNGYLVKTFPTEWYTLSK